MLRQKRWAVWFIVVVGLILGGGTAVAQTNDTLSLSLSLSRDFGAGLGSSIQGTFSFRASGPDNLVRVIFYIDDQVVGEASEAPFRFQFKTDNYPLGVHTLHAVGITEDGRELTSNSISRNFISGSSANRTVFWMIVPIILLSLGGLLFSSWIANRGQKNHSNPTVAAINGPFGGTICPKCSKPFARHIWGLNLVVGKYDRCPHCGKWSLVRALHPDVLKTAVLAMQEAEAAQNPSQPGDPDDPNRWQKRLDDSKYDN